jgi:hypothetical protein
MEISSKLLRFPIFVLTSEKNKRPGITKIPGLKKTIAGLHRAMC